jgi:hypothetical protein
MRNKQDQLKETLTNTNITWSTLYDEKLNVESVNKPFYFGVYRVKERRGFENAQKQFNTRFNKLVIILDKINFAEPSFEKSITKIKGFNSVNKQIIDLKSIEFKDHCRYELLKPLGHIIRKLESKGFESLLNPYNLSTIKKIYYQLSPFNYSYSYLTHFFYVTDQGVKNLLRDDAKRKVLRNIDGIFELTSYISGLELPRRTHKTALFYRYLIVEENAGFDKLESIVFTGLNLSTDIGNGSLESWQLDNGIWKLQATFNQWRR